VKVLPEVMIPLTATLKEMANQAAIVRRVADEVFKEKGRKVDYLVGTMIELPRAALVADEIAKEAQFFSFGTNDLTQTTFGFSRDDVNKVLPTYLAEGILKQDPFAVLGHQLLHALGVAPANVVDDGAQLRGMIGDSGAKAIEGMLLSAQRPKQGIVASALGIVALIIGATSFGGVVPYLRESLVTKNHWVDDKEFVELLSISQSLPGLNSANMAVLVGDRLRGTAGAAVAICGLCLPGGLIMFAIGMLHRQHAARPVAAAMLHGVAAAAVGLVMAVAVQLGRTVVSRIDDLGFVALAVIGVNVLHMPVLVVLVVVGALAIWWHRPRTESPTAGAG
jgi:chromate transporter